MEYIDIVECGQLEGKKTKRFHVINKRFRTLLGEIKWYGSWRQYCFFPESQIVFSTGCMDDICGYIKGLNYQHRRKET